MVHLTSITASLAERLKDLDNLVPDYSIDGVTPVQHTAPCPNDVPAMELVAYILLGAAFFTWGFMKVVRHHIDEGTLPRRADLVAKGVLCALCIVGGAIMGWRFWDSWAGGVLGAVGSGTHTILVHALYTVANKVTRLRLDPDNENGSK